MKFVCKTTSSTPRDGRKRPCRGVQGSVGQYRANPYPRPARRRGLPHPQEGGWPRRRAASAGWGGRFFFRAGGRRGGTGVVGGFKMCSMFDLCVDDELFDVLSRVGGYHEVRGLLIIRMRSQKKLKDCGETVGAWGSKKNNTKKSSSGSETTAVQKK